MAPYYTIIAKDYLLAKSLGIKVNLIFWLTAFFAVVATVSSIILIGVLTLLGMIAPHVARILNPKGNSFKQLLLSFVISLLLLTSSR
jgi:ferrichrome ABC transporter